MLISHKSPNKSARINAKRDAALMAGFEWNGILFQVDERSHGLIANRALTLVKRQLQQESVSDFPWITADNQDYMFTPSEFLDFAEAVNSHVDSLVMEAHRAKHGA